jgi:hypothetical protein
MRFFLLIFVILLTNCETETLIPEDSLTIEGQIEEGEFAKVYLTNSLPFLGRIDSVDVAKSIESKAKVILSDGITSEILTLKRDNTRFPNVFYRSNKIIGQRGTNYSLKVSIRGKEFTATTDIPEKPIVLETSFSNWIEDGIETKSYKNINLLIDNSNKTNRYFKILVKTDEENIFVPANPFLISTENISTTHFSLITNYLDKDDKNEIINRIEVGKIIELKLVAITREQFNFWKSIKGDITTLIQSSSANSINGNISNGAFGYWSGENQEILRFKIPF